MARKRKHPEHVNHERWLVSYADFITLLFAFFTTMYAISTVDAKKAGKLVFAMRAAFNLDFFMSEQPILGLLPPEKAITDPELELERKPHDIEGLFPRRRKVESKETPRAIRPSLRALAEALKHVLRTAEIGRHVKMRMEPRGLVISLEEVGFFEPGRIRLREEAIPLVSELGALLRDLGHPVRVEGHADDQGSHLANWDLSTARAVSIVRMWVGRLDFPPARLSAAGYGSHRPIVPNDDAASRARNRRVDVVILSGEAAREEPP